jgi:hypothetical protein
VVVGGRVIRTHFYFNKGQRKCFHALCAAKRRLFVVSTFYDVLFTWLQGVHNVSLPCCFSVGGELHRICKKVSQRMSAMQTTGQRQTLSAVDVCAESNRPLVFRENVIGFSHNPVMIGVVPSVLVVEPRRTSRKEGEAKEARLSMSDSQKLLDWLDG